MRRHLRVCLFFIAISMVTVIGCTSQTKSVIPNTVPEVQSGMSRIVLTRENQMAGAGSPMIVLDIGRNIEPNAMIYFKDIQAEEILRTDNFASIAGVPGDRIWLWFNPELVKPHFCSNNGPGCIKYHWRWPKSDYGGLLYGTVINLRDGCIVDYGYIAGDQQLEAIRKDEVKAVEIDRFKKCIDFSYTSKKRAVSLIPAVDKLIVKDFFKGFFQGDLRGYEAPRSGGYLLFVNFVAGRKGYPNVDTFNAETIAYEKISRNAQVIGSVEVGDTLVWDRKPGSMRLGSAWYDGLGFMPRNIEVEAGKTYFIHYATRLMGQRWKLKRIE